MSHADVRNVLCLHGDNCLCRIRQRFQAINGIQRNHQAEESGKVGGTREPETGQNGISTCQRPQCCPHDISGIETSDNVAAPGQIAAQELEHDGQSRPHEDGRNAKDNYTERYPPQGQDGRIRAHIGSKRDINMGDQLEKGGSCQCINPDSCLKKSIPFKRTAYPVGEQATQPGTECHAAHIGRHHRISGKRGATEDDAKMLGKDDFIE